MAAPAYTHFTSPIRRYPDLIVHRVVKTLLAEGAEPFGGPEETASSSVQRFAKGVRGNREQEIGNQNLNEAFATTDHGPRTANQFEEPYPREELAAIAQECSETERRAADAERELIEWKKIKFMQDRVGEDFNAMILSVTKYGMFVELNNLYVEGLVPIFSLTDDHYTYRENSREICGARNGRCFRPGQRVRVLLDRIDRSNRRLQFAMLPDADGQSAAPSGTRPFVSRMQKPGNRRGTLEKPASATRTNKRILSSSSAFGAEPASPQRSSKPHSKVSAYSRKKKRR